jgi:hypothetical protein
MSEYTNVERPFLDKLRQLGWEVIDHGPGFIPQDPALYTMFNERLQRILDAHKEHWDVIVTELTNLCDDIGKGRKAYSRTHQPC